MAILAHGKLLASDFAFLFEACLAASYTIIGPKKVGQAITYAKITSPSDLPQGYGDEQEKGTYRLTQRHDKAYFGYNIGARSFKDFLFLPREKMTAVNTSGATQFLSVNKPTKLALFGVRACELHAIQIQDKVFLQSGTVDPHYESRRQHALIVSLNCHTTAKTCFCVSMQTGPEVSPGFDINLSEIITDTDHYFICEAGTTIGQNLLQQCPLQPLTAEDEQRKREMIDQTTAQMHRKLDTQNIKEKLYAAHDHPHWKDVASRCVNCANCTLACPTCFCSKTVEETHLEEPCITRVREWDSCFSQEITHVHEGYVRESAESRYRQWMTHKLGSWIDQFGTSGCVGCGRCITWCPVGIDITEEFALISQSELSHENH